MNMFNSRPDLTSLTSMQQHQAATFLSLTRQVADAQMFMLRTGLAVAQTMQAGWQNYALSIAQAWGGLTRVASQAPARPADRPPAPKTDASGVLVTRSDPQAQRTVDPAGIPIIQAEPPPEALLQAPQTNGDPSGLPIIGAAHSNGSGHSSDQDPLGIPIIGGAADTGQAPRRDASGVPIIEPPSGDQGRDPSGLPIIGGAPSGKERPAASRDRARKGKRES